MTLSNLYLQPIGIIHSPFTSPIDMPIQPAGAKAVSGRIVLQPELVAGLADLEGFSHLILIYWFHLSEGYELVVRPFLDDKSHGVFATRAPRRPNPLGFSVVGLERVAGDTLHITGVDVVDGTPLLDIKPYVPDFDHPDNVRIGWLTRKLGRSASLKSDDRFLA